MVPEMLTEAVRTARKEHVCSGCLEIIPKGSRYHISVWSDDGKLHRSKMCPKCHYVWSHHYGSSNWTDDTWNDGDLAEDHEHIPEDADLLADMEEAT